MSDDLPSGHRLVMGGLAFLDDLAFRRDYGPPLTPKELADLGDVVDGINAALGALRAEGAEGSQ